LWFKIPFYNNPADFTTPMCPTGITLLLVPCGYVILDDIHNLPGMKRDEVVEKVVESA